MRMLQHDAQQRVLFDSSSWSRSADCLDKELVAARMDSRRLRAIVPLELPWKS